MMIYDKVIGYNMIRGRVSYTTLNAMVNYNVYLKKSNLIPVLIKAATLRYLRWLTMETEITNIIANLCTSDMRDTGVAMATMWTYPDSAKDVIPMPLTRYTSFTVYIEGCKVPKCKKAIVTANVSHLAHGVMRAIVTDIVKVIDN